MRLALFTTAAEARRWFWRDVCGKPIPPDLLSTMELTDQDWTTAKDHFDTTRAQYEELRGMPQVNVEAALLFTFRPLAERFEAGERTPELWNAMMEVQ